MSTAFIALFLFGLALLIAREFNLVIDAWTGNVQVAVYLTDPAKRRDRRAAPDHARGALAAVGERRVLRARHDACQQFDELFASQEVFQEGVELRGSRSRRRSASTWPIPAQYDQIAAAMGCIPNDAGQIECTEPGVRNVSGLSAPCSTRLTTITSVLRTACCRSR